MFNFGKHFKKKVLREGIQYKILHTNLNFGRNLFCLEIPLSNTLMYWFMQQFNVLHNRVFTIFTIHVKICKSDKVDGKLDGGEDPT